MSSKSDSEAAGQSNETRPADAGPLREATRYAGYDSFDSLYVVSELELNPPKQGDPREPLELATAVYELVEKRLGWHRVLAIASEEKDVLRSEAVWKLPQYLEGESYLNGMSLISTWDEYSTLADYIRAWDLNLVRSTSFCPVRIEAQRRDRPDLEKAAALPQDGAEVPSLLDKRIQFKEDLVIATRENGETLIRYIPVAVYKRNDVTNRFRFVETLAKNGVTMAEVSQEHAEMAGAKHPFTFINLRGLREKTEWS